MDGKLIVEAGCHLPDGVLARLNIERLTDPDCFETRLLDDWLYQGDDWLVLASKQGVTRWQAIVQRHQAEFPELRLAASLQRPFRVRFIACEARYASLGLIAAQLAQYWAAGHSIDSVRSHLDEVEQSIQTTAVGVSTPWLKRWLSPTALLNANQRRRDDGATSLHRFLQIADRSIPNQALINLSVAGDSSQIQLSNEFQAFCRRRSQAGGLCWLSEMDADCRCHFDTDAVSLAWINAPALRETP